MPQRAYAFAGVFDSAAASLDSADFALQRPASVPRSAPAPLSRPVSAPARGEPLAPFRRASSPLRRVANPMVRDTHFRRGLEKGKRREERKRQ